MEELSQHYILTSTLSPSFNQKQWNIIIREPPKLFQSNQRKIHQFLSKSGLQKKNLLEKFKRNHRTIYNWFLLATRNRVQIQPYIYQQILQNPSSFHNNQISIPIESSFPHRKSRMMDNQNHKWLNQEVQQLKLRQSIDLNDNIDGHQLYLRTFDACKGDRYVPYDCNRHMLSQQKRMNYNFHIRTNHKRSTTTLSSKENCFQKFAQWKKDVEKSSLLTFQAVLNDQNLNSEKGLQILLKKQGCRKLVLINHQRKPVNYYLRPHRQSMNKE